MALNDLTNQNIQDTYQKVVQTDGVNLADGTGSALPIKFDGPDLIVSGALRAQSYIVSESVVNVSSGSTIFGDSTDDSHTFKGNITASGTISSSNTITANAFTTGDVCTIENGNITILNNLSAGNSEINDLQLLRGKIKFEGNVTASGHISSSETIHAIDYYDNGTNINTIYSPIAGGTDIVTVGTIGTGVWQGTTIQSQYLDGDTAHLSTDQTFTGKKTFTSAITSSHISSSATLTANLINLPDADSTITTATASLAYIMSEPDTSDPKDTKIRLSNDAMQVTVGNLRFINLYEYGTGNSSIDINPEKEDINFRVRGDNNNDLIWTDAGADKVAIGTGTVGNSLLTVDGDITLTNITSSGTISASGMIQTAGAISSSTGITASAALFSGDITSSGHISSSLGKVVAGGGYYTPTSRFIDVSADNAAIQKSNGGSLTTLSIKADRLDTVNLKLTGHITASGIISSSNSLVTNHITSSGNISSSGGNIIANFPDTNDDADHYPTVVTSQNSTLETQNTLSINPSTNTVKIALRNIQVSTTGDHNVGTGDVVFFGGGSTTQGNICYLQTNGEWGDALADATNTSTQLLAIALGDDPDVDGMLLRGMITLDHDVGNNQGVPLYLSDTAAGQATVTAPSSNNDVVRIIGYNMGDDDEIWFCPDNTWVVVSA